MTTDTTTRPDSGAQGAATAFFSCRGLNAYYGDSYIVQNVSFDIAEGQILGSFAQGIGTALYEEFVYGEDGSFRTATFADYLVPTVNEVPPVEILHMETASPFTPLGAKGLAEGNCMTTPVCIANAVADALGVKDVPLPMTPKRIHALMARGEEPPRSEAGRSRCW